jgi:hypothetical protein
MHLLAQMPPADFLAYEAYARERWLPLDRIETQLARVVMLLTRAVNPGADLRLQDFFLPPQAREAPASQPEATEEEAQKIVDAIGFKAGYRKRRPDPPTDPAEPEPPAPSPPNP